MGYIFLDALPQTVEGLSASDFWVISIYMVIVLVIAFVFSKGGQKTTEDFFLAGRNIGWFAVGASLFAANFSSEHVIGITDSGYSEGMSAANFEWFACFIMLFMAWFFVPFYVKNQIFTTPEFIERRFGAKSRWYLSVVSIITYIITKVSVSLYAGGLLLQSVFGWDIYEASLLLLLITGLYTVAGGIRSVIFTGAFQTIIILASGVVLAYACIKQAGGFEAMINDDNIPEKYFSTFKPLSDDNYPWVGMLFGAPILGIWYWCTDQFIVQRILSSKNVASAKRGTIFGAYLKLLPVLLFTLAGIALYAVQGTPLKEKEHALSIIFSSGILGEGFKGLVVAGLLAALMSSIATCFNSSSTLFTFDIYKKLYPDAGEFQLVNVGRFATFAVVIFSILWVPFLNQLEGNLVQYLQSIQGYIAPPITVVFLCALLWSRASGKAAFIVLVTGGIIGITRLILEKSLDSSMEGTFIYSFANINFLYFSILLFLFCFALMVVISYTQPRPEQSQLDGLTLKFSKGTFQLFDKEDGKSGNWKKFNIAASILLILVVLTFWLILRTF